MIELDKIRMEKRRAQNYLDNMAAEESQNQIYKEQLNQYANVHSKFLDVLRGEGSSNPPQPLTFAQPQGLVQLPPPPNYPPMQPRPLSSASSSYEMESRRTGRKAKKSKEKANKNKKRKYDTIPEDEESEDSEEDSSDSFDVKKKSKKNRKSEKTIKASEPEVSRRSNQKSRKDNKELDESKASDATLDENNVNVFNFASDRNSKLSKDEMEEAQSTLSKKSKGKNLKLNIHQDSEKNLQTSALNPRQSKLGQALLPNPQDGSVAKMIPRGSVLRSPGIQRSPAKTPSPDKRPLSTLEPVEFFPERENIIIHLSKITDLPDCTNVSKVFAYALDGDEIFPGDDKLPYSAVSLLDSELFSPEYHLELVLSNEATKSKPSLVLYILVVTLEEMASMSSKFQKDTEHVENSLNPCIFAVASFPLFIEAGTANNPVPYSANSKVGLVSRKKWELNQGCHGLQLLFPQYSEYSATELIKMQKE